MENTRFCATGRRKCSVARVVVIPGKGNMTVNGKTVSDFFCRETLVSHAKAPLVATENATNLDVHCKTSGGGITGQAGAIRLAVARALKAFNPDLHSILRKGGFLTRDAREVERKKYGQPKARKRFQYSKR